MFEASLTILILVALEGIKRLVTWTPHASDYFYFNLFSCMQVFVLVGCILVLITRPLLKRFIKRRFFLWQLLGYVLLVLLMEWGCSYLLNHPRSIPNALFPSFKFYYDHFECRIIQYEPAHTRYDTALYYTLKSNVSFTYSNREYDNAFATNSKGLRDDEASLTQPRIICLGDSYTLGWGADEQQSYPAMVERQTGLKVLNAGMSSYGTARESRLLSTLDTSQVQYVIWQYCANDQEENEAYITTYRSSPSHTPQSLDSVMELHAWTRQYFPCRHLFTLAKLSANQLVNDLSLPMKPAPAPPTADSVFERNARDFLSIVTTSSVDLVRTKIIVLELGPFPIEGRFIHHLKNLVQQRGLTQSFLFIDASTLLSKDDFYILDVHLNQQGNRKVAEALTRMINGL